MDHARSGWRGRGLGLGLACLLMAAAGPARAEGATPPAGTPAAPASPGAKPAAPASPAAGKPHLVKLAFLGLRPLAGVDKGKAQAVSAYLLDALQQRGVYQVLAPDDVKALLGLEAQKQLLGCDEDSSCLAQIAGSLGATRLLDGTLARIGNSILLSVNLLDTTKAEAVIRASRRVKTDSTLEPVLDVIPGLVDQIVAGDPAVQKLRAAEAHAGAAPHTGSASTGAGAAASTGAGSGTRTAAATGPAAGSGTKAPPPRIVSPRRPHLTLGIEGRVAGNAWSTGGGPGGSLDLFGLLRLGWIDLGVTAGVEADLYGSSVDHGALRVDALIHLWRLPYVQLYAGPGIRFAPLGLRVVVGGDWPLHVFGREDFAIVSDVVFEMYKGGNSLGLALGLGYSFL